MGSNESNSNSNIELELPSSSSIMLLGTLGNQTKNKQEFQLY